MLHSVVHLVVVFRVLVRVQDLCENPPARLIPIQVVFLGKVFAQTGHCGAVLRLHFQRAEIANTGLMRAQVRIIEDQLRGSIGKIP